jgi:acyl carrier protein
VSHCWRTDYSRAGRICAATHIIPLRPAAAPEAEGVADIAAKVVMIISGHLGIDPTSVVSAASLTDDLGADSLDTVELVMAFEEAFGFEIPEADVERIRTVKDAIEYVRSRTASG